jgi:hypothetical protein
MDSAAAKISGGQVTSIGQISTLYPNSPTLSYVKQSNVPVAQYSQTPLKQVTFSGNASPSVASGSALPPDRNVYYSLVQQQQDLTNARNLLEAQRQAGAIDDATYNTQMANVAGAQTAVASDIKAYQTNLQNYQGSDIRTQAMLASVITGYKENAAQFSNPKDVWTHSSVRVFKDGVWQTLPEAYTATYGGDPYADVASTKFLELSMANALRSGSEAAAHVTKLLSSSNQSSARADPAEVNVTYPETGTPSSDMPPSSNAASAPSGPTMWDTIAPYLTASNIVKVLVLAVIVIVAMRMMED